MKLLNKFLFLFYQRFFFFVFVHFVRALVCVYIKLKTQGADSFPLTSGCLTSDNTIDTRLSIPVTFSFSVDEYNETFSYRDRHFTRGTILQQSE